ncbi:hypothetical protein BASA81_003464 [Batrachochytrium salamandrivorans]|nr:hypothetical protein BASA81_003464 [Batrachochytrium salamandrivorans]
MPPPFGFTDIHQEPRKDIWEPKGPRWRFVDTWGLFTLGQCLEEHCLAQNELVVSSPMYTSQTEDGTYVWLFTRSGGEVSCPCCGGEVYPNGLGFTNCLYRVNGVREDNNFPIALATESWSDVSDAVGVSWNELDCGLVGWQSLQVLVRFKQRCFGWGRCGPMQYLPLPVAEDCPICFDAMPGSERTQLPYCRHAFHAKCIATWKAAQRRCFHGTTCPLCRHGF